jgi:hypothetical protein
MESGSRPPQYSVGSTSEHPMNSPNPRPGMLGGHLPQPGVAAASSPGALMNGQSSMGQNFPVEDPMETEKKVAEIVNEELMNVKKYADVEKSGVIWTEENIENKTVEYKAKILFHNKTLCRLSYQAQSSLDNKLYEVTFLPFYSSSIRDKMFEFLETLKRVNHPDVRNVHKFSKKENEDRPMLVLVDYFQHFITLSELIALCEAKPEILTNLRRPEFLFKVITVVWDTIRRFKTLGLENLGIHTGLIMMLDQRTNMYSIKDVTLKMKKFFSEPTVIVDYKFAHFMRFILSSDKKGADITLYDLAKIGFVPEVMVEAMSRDKIIYSDHHSFAIILMELLVGKHSSKFSSEIDFKNGKISPELIKAIDHPFFSQVIQTCLATNGIPQLMQAKANFFTDSNKEFMTLARFLNSEIEDENNEALDLSKMNPLILTSGLTLIDKGKIVYVLSNCEYNDPSMPNETIEALTKFLWEMNFLRYCFVFVKNGFTKFQTYTEIYNVFPLIFFLVEKTLTNRKINYSMKLHYLHTEELKQLMSIAPTVLFHPSYNK